MKWPRIIRQMIRGSETIVVEKGEDKMAGGWDGDALAGQMEDANERAQAVQERTQERSDLDYSTQAERAERTRLETLRLSYARTKEQLESATNTTHRAMLEKALHALTAKMTGHGSEG